MPHIGQPPLLTFDEQRELIGKVDVEICHTDYPGDRPMLWETPPGMDLMRRLKSGDTVKVATLATLGKTAAEIARTLSRLDQNNAIVKVSRLLGGPVIIGGVLLAGIAAAAEAQEQHATVPKPGRETSSGREVDRLYIKYAWRAYDEHTRLGHSPEEIATEWKAMHRRNLGKTWTAWKIKELITYAKRQIKEGEGDVRKDQ